MLTTRTPLRPGSVVFVAACYTYLFHNALLVGTNDATAITVVGEQTLFFAEEPNMSQRSWINDESGRPRVPVETAAAPAGRRNTFAIRLDRPSAAPRRGAPPSTR